MRVVFVNPPLPLIGHIAFGIIDRGTSVIQVRPTSICGLNCVFCSVDAGPYSKRRVSEYIVKKPEQLVEWAGRVASIKGSVEALIDGAGEPLTYPWIVELVEGLKRLRSIRSVALETRGYLLTRRLVDRLEEAGLDRINLSIDALNPELARRLAGVRWFNVGRVVKAAEYVARETGIDLHIAPLWLPGLNDDEIPRIIEWGLRIGAGRKWPPFGIQKYVAHKYGRRPPGVREVGWGEFYGWLERLERHVGVSLRPRPEDFGFRSAPRYPVPLRRGDKVRVEVVLPGWMRGEMIGSYKKRVLVTIVGSRGLELGDRVPVRIIRDKDGILIGVPL